MNYLIFLGLLIILAAIAVGLLDLDVYNQVKAACDAGNTNACAELARTWWFLPH